MSRMLIGDSQSQGEACSGSGGDDLPPAAFCAGLARAACHMWPWCGTVSVQVGSGVLPSPNLGEEGLLAAVWKLLSSDESSSMQLSGICPG
jgi:hypothetical protein